MVYKTRRSATEPMSGSPSVRHTARTTGGAERRDAREVTIGMPRTAEHYTAIAKPYDLNQLEDDLRVRQVIG
jgi:hypothetical protein